MGLKFGERRHSGPYWFPHLQTLSPTVCKFLEEWSFHFCFLSDPFNRQHGSSSLGLDGWNVCLSVNTTMKIKSILL